MNMFEYLTGGQCYKCGGKVKYPDGGMTEQPMSPGQQMMMGQQMPQQPAAPQAKTLDAFADQLITFLLDQLNKGTSMRILKKTLTDSGLKSEEADQVLQIAKQQFDTVSYENQDQKDQMMQQMMQQQQMMGQQQGQPMQQMPQMTPEDMTAPGEDIAEAQYGGMMTGRRLKRYRPGGPQTINTNSQNPPNENEAWIRAMLQYEKSKGRMDNGKAVGHDTWGFNDKTLKALGATAPTSEAEAYDLFKKHYLPKYQNLPLEERMRAADFGFNSGENYKIYELKQYLESQKDDQGNPITFDRQKYFIRDDAMDKLYPEAKYKNNSDQRIKDIAAERERRTKALETDYGKYFQDLDKLPADKKAEMLDAGRDFYYQNLNKNPDGSPNAAYNESWKGRIELYKNLKAKQASGNTSPQEDKEIQNMQNSMNSASSANQSMTDAANTAAPNTNSITVTNNPDKIKKMRSGNTTGNNSSNPNNTSPVKSPSWNVPDWSDPYGTEGQLPSALDTVKFDPEEQYKKDLKAEEEGLNDSDLFFPEDKQSRGLTDKDREKITGMKSDPEAVRQLTPVRTETRRHMVQDVGSGAINRGLAKSSGLADPNVAGMIAALPSKGGLGSMAKVAAGLVGAGSAFALGIQKVKPNETTVEYNADGQVISREGGEWNPFVDNRRKLRIGMQLYGGGGPIGSEVSPLPIEGWAQMSGRNPMSLTDQDQKDYQEYVTKFDPFKNSNNKGGNNNTVTVPPASNNQVAPPAGNSGTQGGCPPGQDCSGQNASDPKWWQFGKRMQQEYGNTKRGDELGTTLAGRTLTGLSLANMGLDEIEARKQQEQLAINTRQQNNSMNAYNPLNLQGQMGVMNVNAGLGANLGTRHEGAIADVGTAIYGAKSGGQMKYKQGGTYTVSPEELMRIINMGGEVEFLD